MTLRRILVACRGAESWTKGLQPFEQRDIAGCPEQHWFRYLFNPAETRLNAEVGASEELEVAVWLWSV